MAHAHDSDGPGNSGHPRRGRRPTRKESQEETRRRLIESAIALIAAHGVAATSLNAVAENAGFSRGAVHGNFSDKAELCAAVAASVTSELEPALTRTLTAPASASHRLADYIRIFLDYCRQRPAAAAALISILGHRGPGRAPAGGESYRDRADRSADDLARLFADGQAAGEMRAFDPQTMAFALRSVLDTAAARISSGTADTITSTARSLTEELTEIFVSATRAR